MWKTQEQRRELGVQGAIGVVGSLIATAVVALIGELLDVFEETSARDLVIFLAGLVIVITAAVGVVAAVVAKRRERSLIGVSIPITVAPELVEEIFSDLTPEEREVVSEFHRDPFGSGWEVHRRADEIRDAAFERWRTGARRG